MSKHWTSTERDMTAAQERLIGRFCSRCRTNRSTDGGATIQAGSGRTRWVCASCLAIIRKHKLKMEGGRE